MEKEQGKQFILFWEISNEGARDSSDVTLALGHGEGTVHSHYMLARFNPLQSYNKTRERGSRGEGQKGRDRTRGEWRVCQREGGGREGGKRRKRQTGRQEDKETDQNTYSREAERKKAFLAVKMKARSRQSAIGP